MAVNLFIRAILLAVPMAATLACAGAAVPVGDGPPDSVVAVRAIDGDVRIDSAPGLTANTQYQAGSIAKWACTVAALRQVDRSHFTLDSTLDELLPAYSGPGASRVRLRDLLANRAGLADGLTPTLSPSSMSCSPSSATLSGRGRST